MGRVWLAGAVVALNFCVPAFAQFNDLPQWWRPFKPFKPSKPFKPFSQPVAVSEDDVRQWLAVWQKREGLEHRDIRLRFVHQNELGRNGFGKIIANISWGETWWALEPRGAAHICFIYPEELETVFGETPAEARDEAQRAVIHELMHLVIAGLYDDGSGRGNTWINDDTARNARMEAITDNLAVMLLRRHVPGNISVARYISRQINSGPWRPAQDVRERIMLQIARAVNAATEDDLMTLARR